jgi:regulator of sirC expression with transglutaminase-like and TPR domain
MQASKFNALLKLLDDTDPTVQTQVENEFYNQGAEVLHQLEEASETTDNADLQSRIEALISRIQLGRFSDELLQWRKNGGEDLLEGWLLVTQTGNPTLNPQKYKSAVSRLTHRTWLQLNNGMSDLEKLCVINKLLFGLEGYNGNYLRPMQPENNYLNELIDSKQGNSLSLSTLYSLLARELNIPLQIVNFHGYFALRYYTEQSHFYIDAFNKGLFFTPHQVERFLDKMELHSNVLSYKPLSRIYVVLQLIESLIMNYEQDEQHEEANRFRRLLQNIEISFEGSGSESGPDLGGDLS